ncbi:MAG: glucose-1-phosphate thymidylyltransferase RfbA [Mycobacteriales bacterium]
MRGILLAGGKATRLRPATAAVCKQLLPIYDKPMVYYPLATLMRAGIREVLLICAPDWRDRFERLFGDGSQLGLRIDYVVQDAANGIAEALLLGADFVGEEPFALVLGDNLFHGIDPLLRDAAGHTEGCTLFGCEVNDPEAYGVIETDGSGRIVGIAEKPEHPRSRMVVTGLYFYDRQAVHFARRLTPSARGELEITDVNNAYVRSGQAKLASLGPGAAWLDMGTHESLLEAGQFVQVLEHRQGLAVACLEEIALAQGWIDAPAARALGEAQSASAYGRYVVAAADRVVR